MNEEEFKNIIKYKNKEELKQIILYCYNENIGLKELSAYEIINDKHIISIFYDSIDKAIISFYKENKKSICYKIKSTKEILNQLEKKLDKLDKKYDSLVEKYPEEFI